MNIKKNVISNYIGQIYVSLIGIIVYPFYLGYLGPEAYGLVGFFIVLQGWLQLLDMGMTPTIARELAFVRGGNRSFFEFKKQLRSIELVFVLLSVLLITTFIACNNWIASSWLKVGQLDVNEVTYSLLLIAVIISLRWIASLYKSGLNGLEMQVWLNVVNSVFASIRFLGALGIMHWVSTNYVLFFEFQLLISVFELLVFLLKLYRSLPLTEKVKVKIYYAEMKPVLPFALSIGYTTGIWVFMTQLDKLLLSNVLTLTEYGYFTIVAILSSGILQLAAPIGNALMPRLTFLLAENKKKDMLLLYRKATQLMAVVMFPLVGFVAVYANEILYVWTGNREAAEWAGPVLFWYVLGGGTAAIVSFQYYLQYVYGDLKLFVLINTVTAIVYIPLIVFTVFKYGALGAGKVWFFLHILSFLFVTYIVHRKFAPNIHFNWVFKDILPILGLTIVGILITLKTNIVYDISEQVTPFLSLFFLGFFVFIVAAIGNFVIRKVTKYFVKNNV